MTLITRCPYAANVLAVQNQGMNLSKVNFLSVGHGCNPVEADDFSLNMRRREAG